MEDIRELYEELLLLCRNEVCSLHDYRILRESFERVIREKVQLVGLQTTDLAARINYLSNSVALDNKTRNALACLDCSNRLPDDTVVVIVAGPCLRTV